MDQNEVLNSLYVLESLEDPVVGACLRKTISPELTHEQAHQIAKIRLKNEWNQLRRIHGPFFVKAFSTGEEYRNEVVLEKINGLNLYELLLKTELDSEEVKAIALQLLSALEYLEKSKIVHRDLCPTNIMLSSEGELKVIDFGIAVDVEHRSKIVIGTPPYLSSEQVKCESISHNTDVVVAGLTVWTLLTRRSPYESLKAPELFTRILSNPIPDAKPVKLSLEKQKFLEPIEKCILGNAVALREFCSDLSQKSAQQTLTSLMARCRL